MNKKYNYIKEASPFGSLENNQEKKDDLVASQNHPQPLDSVATLACTEGNSIEQEGGYYYDLFKFFSEQHGLTLVDTEIQDIIRAVEVFNNHPIRKIINSDSIEQRKKTLVISAFPGTGKTYLAKRVNSLDSDSSNFSWLPGTKIRNQKFPYNYIEHIKANIGKYDFIFVSSHKDVRTCMIMYGIDFLSAYPEKSLKQEYLNRYKERGSDEDFIKMMDANWDSFIGGMENLQVMEPLILKSGQYLSDYFVLNLQQKVHECDARKADGSDTAGSQKPPSK
jgi:hypothetical protein